MVKIVDLRELKKGVDADKKPIPETKSDKSAILEWQVEEFKKENRELGWYIGLFTIATILAIISIFLKNYFFVVVIAIGVVTILIVTAQEPRKLKVLVHEKGISINDKKYLFQEFSGFGIDETQPEARVLKLRFSGLFHLPLLIPIGKYIDSDKIREIFLPHMKEEKVFASALDNVTKNIKL